MLAAALPERIIGTEFGVCGGEPVGELGGETLALAVSRPGPPLQGMGVEIFVHTGSRTVGVAGVLAHDAFVVVRHHDAGDLPHPHRQPVAVVDRAAEGRHRLSQFGREGDPTGHVIISEVSDSAHRVMVIAGWAAVDGYRLLNSANASALAAAPIISAK